MMKNRVILILSVLLSIALLILVTTLVFVSHNISDKKEDPEATFAVLSAGLHDQGMMVTQEYLTTVIGQGGDNLEAFGLNVPFTGNKFLYSCDISIKAGVDFSRIDISSEGTVIKIAVPGAEIISSEIDTGSFKLYDQKNNIFNPIELEDKNKVDSKLIEEAKESAVKAGVLSKAEENALLLVENFVYEMLSTMNTDIQYAVQASLK